MPGELHLLPGRQIGEELARKAAALGLEALQLRFELLVVLGEGTELPHSGDELDDRFFEGQDVGSQTKERSYTERPKLSNRDMRRGPSSATAANAGWGSTRSGIR